MEHRIGSQTLDINGDFAFITLNGELLPEQMRTLLTLLEGMNGGEGKIYVLANIRRLNGAHPETRRIAGAWQGIGRVQCTAVVGANLVTRTLVLLVSRASTMLSNTRKTGELNFFNTEEEARAWIDSHRTA